MLLGEGAVFGKCLAMGRAQLFYFRFCQAMEIPFNDKTIDMTFTSGSSVALICGMTTHNAVYLNNSKIKDDFRKVDRSSCLHH
jgi:uncharacterized membrane protein YraQ (UPF0718 family)